MAKMTRIWIAETGPAERGIDLRIDWDNDRHQGIRMNSSEPEDVVQGLLDAARLINKERRADKI